VLIFVWHLFNVRSQRDEARQTQAVANHLPTAFAGHCVWNSRVSEPNGPVVTIACGAALFRQFESVNDLDSWAAESIVDARIEDGFRGYENCNTSIATTTILIWVRTATGPSGYAGDVILTDHAHLIGGIVPADIAAANGSGLNVNDPVLARLCEVWQQPTLSQFR
jgi:hypothetical protein